MTTKKFVFIVIALVFICALVLGGCAPASTEEGSTSSQPTVLESSGVRFQHLVGTALSEYRLDYVEDRQNGYGCYVYDGNESGSIFCFKLDQ